MNEAEVVWSPADAQRVAREGRNAMCIVGDCCRLVPAMTHVCQVVLRHLPEAILNIEVVWGLWSQKEPRWALVRLVAEAVVLGCTLRTYVVLGVVHLGSASRFSKAKPVLS